MAEKSVDGGVTLSRNAEKIIRSGFFFALIGAAVAIGLYVLKFQLRPLSDDPEQWGQFGDFFAGVLGPTFGFVSLLALLFTLRLQANELRHSQSEQSETRKALQFQNQAIQQQRLEQTFFSWLGTYRQILGEVEYHEERGRQALLYIWRERLAADYIGGFRDDYIPALGTVPDALYQLQLKGWHEVHKVHHPVIVAAVLDAWEDLYREHEPRLDSLFRVLYRLIKWIDEQPAERLSWEDKWLYISIVRSQLSWIEMVLLFYNGMTARGARFKPFIEKYALFDNLTTHSDTLLVIVRECPMDAIGYAETAYSSDAARAAHTDAEGSARN